MNIRVKLKSFLIKYIYYHVATSIPVPDISVAPYICHDALFDDALFSQKAHDESRVMTEKRKKILFIDARLKDFN